MKAVNANVVDDDVRGGRSDVPCEWQHKDSEDTGKDAPQSAGEDVGGSCCLMWRKHLGSEGTWDEAGMRYQGPVR